VLGIPTWIWLFIFALIAAVAGRMLAGRVGDDPGSMPGRILYAVAAACVVAGLATLWLNHV